MQHATKLLIVDDQTQFRHSVVYALRSAQRLEVAGQTGNSQTAMRLYAEKRPDVVLLAMNLPERSSIDVLNYIQAQDYAAAVILLIGRKGNGQFRQALALNAAGYLSRDSLNKQRLVHAILVAATSEMYIDPNLLTGLAANRTNAVDARTYS